jgi:predicted oxidoreductase
MGLVCRSISTSLCVLKLTALDSLRGVRERIDKIFSRCGIATISKHQCVFFSVSFYLLPEKYYVYLSTSLHKKKAYFNIRGGCDSHDIIHS